MILKYNNYPHSACSCEKGIKHLIGESLSVSFNKEKFKEQADEIGVESIKTFANYDDAIAFVNNSGIAIVNGNNYYMLEDTRKKVNYDFLNIKANIHIYSGVIYEYEVFLFTKIIGRVRNAYSDEKMILLKWVVDSKCVMCKKKVDGYNETLHVFEYKSSFRTECVCIDCLEKITKNPNNRYFDRLFDKTDLLIKIISNME